MRDRESITKEIAEGICAKVSTDQQAMSLLQHGALAGLKEVIEGYFSCESVDDSPIDYVGEVISRRLVCDDLQNKLREAEKQIAELTRMERKLREQLNSKTPAKSYAIVDGDTKVYKSLSDVREFNLSLLKDGSCRLHELGDEYKPVTTTRWEVVDSE